MSSVSGAAYYKLSFPEFLPAAMLTGEAAPLISYGAAEPQGHVFERIPATGETEDSRYTCCTKDVKRGEKKRKEKKKT